MSDLLGSACLNLSCDTDAKHMRRVNNVYTEERGVSVRVDISCRHTEHRIVMVYILVITNTLRSLWSPHPSLQALVQIHDGPEQRPI